MVKLIGMVCPHVEFYVAKIGQWSRDGMNRKAALGEHLTAKISAEVGEFLCSDTPYYISHCNPDVQGQTSSRNEAASETMGRASEANSARQAVDWVRGEKVDVIPISQNPIETRNSIKEIKGLLEKCWDIDGRRGDSKVGRAVVNGPCTHLHPTEESWALPILCPSTSSFYTHTQFNTRLLSFVPAKILCPADVYTNKDPGIIMFWAAADTEVPMARSNNFAPCRLIRL
ncbi:hypothetical protein CCUS01_14131 [Colletotrichum cuscutae]|uniref:Uncharacterized protein n=1 Tax=Colletotrichum cuscutae TaxID=1209917 RepID=A0AAJ0DLY1_9PEZI|nr:hypothetical protein CCUS01_14131 [Colletotrichum cuscutae]